MKIMPTFDFINGSEDYRGIFYQKTLIATAINSSNVLGLIFTLHVINDTENNIQRTNDDFSSSGTLKVIKLLDDQSLEIEEELTFDINPRELQYWNNILPDFVFFTKNELMQLCNTEENTDPTICFSGSIINYGESYYENGARQTMCPTLKAEVMKENDRALRPLVSIGVPCPTRWEKGPDLPPQISSQSL